MLPSIVYFSSLCNVDGDRHEFVWCWLCRVVGGNAVGNGYWYSMSPASSAGGVLWAAPCAATDAAKILVEMQALVCL